ncbi:sigma-70 RNA polymerase sigma factor region 4 domain-containing protein [Lignipirellula cremea]|uniref:RNA polymerase sigma factor n=1 Tax=Lignipirellula cremea TaxID=2528010 RepID=A0A518E0H4_9BACT|nr:sigma-70 family RNA polymerase sigma factor [Lignipirellula cremea]QDU97583.1 hypothetical protein Pla8534_54330 [Lignipirellula cremea]
MSATSTSATTLSAETLFRRLKRRDPSAWRRFAVLYGPLVYSWARQAGRTPPEANKFVATFARRLASRIDEYRPEQGKFRDWLATQCQKLLDTQEPEEASEAAFNRKQWGGVILRALYEAGDTQQQTLFRRVMFDKESTEAVAQDGGLSKMSVYEARSRILHQLRGDLSAELAPGEKPVTRTPTGCLNPQAIHTFSIGLAPQETIDAAVVHLKACETCRESLWQNDCSSDPLVNLVRNLPPVEPHVDEQECKLAVNALKTNLQWMEPDGAPAKATKTSAPAASKPAKTKAAAGAAVSAAPNALGPGMWITLAVVAAVVATLSLLVIGAW